MKQSLVKVILVILIVSASVIFAQNAMLNMLDDIIVKQKEQYDLLKRIQTLEDFKTNYEKIFNLSETVLQMTHKALKYHLNLNTQEQKKFLDKNKELQRENANLGLKIKQERNRIKKINGVRPLLKQLRERNKGKYKKMMLEIFKMYSQIERNVKLGRSSAVIN